MTQFDTLRHELNQCRARSEAIETDLTIEREWRTRLEENSMAQTEKVAVAEQQLQQMKALQRVRNHVLFILSLIYCMIILFASVFL